MAFKCLQQQDKEALQHCRRKKKEKTEKKKNKNTFSLQIDSSFLLPFQEKGKSP